MTPPLLHEWHLLGNIPGCKHCHRMEHMLNPRPGDECPARLLEALDASQEVVAGMSSAVEKLQSWFDRTSSLSQEEAHDVRNVLFMAESWKNI